MRKTTYQTEQKRIVLDWLGKHTDSYHTVDEIHRKLIAHNTEIGRTTVYRCLESLAAEHLVSKVSSTRGNAAQYRLIQTYTDALQGQLLCISCNKAYPLDCTMLESFATHVQAHHGFQIQQDRTVFCGICADCADTFTSPTERKHHECSCESPTH